MDAVERAWADLEARGEDAVAESYWASFVQCFAAKQYALRSRGEEHRTWLARADAGLDAMQRLTETDWPDGRLDLAIVRARGLRLEEDQCAADEVLAAALAGFPAAAAMRPSALLDRADIARLRWDWPAALALLDEVEASLDEEAHSDHRLWRGAWAGLWAQTLLDLGLPDRAAPWIEREAESAATSGNTLAGIQTVTRGAHFRIALHDCDGAVRLLAQALERDADGGDPRQRQKLLLLQGVAQAEAARSDTRRTDAALALLEGVAANEATQRIDRIAAHLALGELALRRGELEEAGERVARAREALPAETPECDGNALLPRLRCTVLEARLALASGADDAGALRPALTHDLDRLLARWTASPELEGGIAFLHFAWRRAAVAAALDLLLAEAPDEPERALELLFAAQSRGSLARELAGAGADASVAGARALLPENGGWLVYHPAEDGTHLFALDARGVEHLRLAPLGVLDRLRRELVDALRSAPPRPTPSTELAALTRELGDELLPPRLAERIAGWERVWISGQDLLGYLPFEALRPGGGQALGLRWAVAYLSSPALGAALRSRARADSAEREQALLLLASRADGLPWTSALAERLTAPYARVHAAEPATRAALAARGPAARVTQVVAHGAYDWSRSVPSGLRLDADGGEGETLWADAVPAGASPLVVLAACGASRSPLRRGEDGAQHLGGTFLRRGAGAVVLSHQDIDLHATVALLEVFHRALAEGASPAEALRTARVALAQDERYAHPFYHSLLHVVGLGHDPVF